MHTDAVPVIQASTGIVATDGLCTPRDSDSAYLIPDNSIAQPEYIFSGQLGPEFELFPPLEMCIAVTARIRPNNTGNVFTYVNTAIDPPVAGYLEITESSVTLSMPETTATFDTAHLNLTDDTFKQIQVCTQANGFATLYVDCYETGEPVTYLPQQHRLGTVDGIVVLGNPFAGDIFQVSLCGPITFVEVMCMSFMTLV